MEELVGTLDEKIREVSDAILVVKAKVDMRIFINIPGGRRIALDVKAWDTIETVKTKISDRGCIVIGGQYRLYFGSKQLVEDKVTLFNNNIKNESTLHIDGSKLYCSCYV